MHTLSETSYSLQDQPSACMLTLHLSLGVDNDTGVVLKVDEGSLFPPPGLALADDHCWGHCVGDQGMSVNRSEAGDLVKSAVTTQIGARLRKHTIKHGALLL